MINGHNGNKSSATRLSSMGLIPSQLTFRVMRMTISFILMALIALNLTRVILKRGLNLRLKQGLLLKTSSSDWACSLVLQDPWEYKKVLMHASISNGLTIMISLCCSIINRPILILAIVYRQHTITLSLMLTRA